MAFFPDLLELQQPMYTLVFFTFSLLSFSLLCYSLYKRLHRTEGRIQNRILEHRPRDPSSTNLTHSLLLEILPSNSAKWEGLFGGDVGRESGVDGSERLGGERGEGDSGVEQREKKKKKKRVKKKRAKGGEDGVEEKEKKEKENEKQELVCLYPFTSSSSATQRKIKQQYDQLVKCHGSKGLTLAQVGQFANCLIDARNELQHKSEVIQRKFTITKALLLKADRSSFDRLRQQIYKLEMEQKRLEEDAFVYNWLQQQLKLSPAYKKMLEINACMELKAKSGELMEGTESTDTEFSDISFEELLAQEKKDSFWQKNGKPRPCSS